MSIQIAVRLPDDLVDALDTMVVESEESGRASVIERAGHGEKSRALIQEGPGPGVGNDDLFVR